jgi:hypothetical protein
MLGAEIDRSGFLALLARPEKVTHVVTLRPSSELVGDSAVAGVMAPIEIFRDGAVDGMAHQRKPNSAEPAVFAGNKR